MDSPTFSSFLTPQGIIVAGGLVTGFVQLLKTTFPMLDARLSGAAQAFGLTAVLYVITGFVTAASTPDALLLVGSSWLACATSSVGTYAAIKHVKAA